MNDFTMVCKEAKIKLRAAQKIKSENPSRFESILLASYIKEMGISIDFVKSIYNSGFTKDDIHSAITLYAQNNKLAITKDDAKVMIKRVNESLKEYRFNSQSLQIKLDAQSESWGYCFISVGEDKEMEKAIALYRGLELIDTEESYDTIDFYPRIRYTVRKNLTNIIDLFLKEGIKVSNAQMRTIFKRN